MVMEAKSGNSEVSTCAAIHFFVSSILIYLIPRRSVKCTLKRYCDQKLISFFSSDFESVFAKHPTGKILSFVFYPKAAYFECIKFWNSRSAITHVQN